MSVLLWGGNVLNDMSVSSSVLFLLLEVPVEDCTPTVIPLQYIQCTGQSLPVTVVGVLASSVSAITK